MNVNTNSFFVSLILGHIQHYNHNRYWSLREKVINANIKTPKILKYLYLLYIKRCDAYNCASLGTDINAGAVFAQPPLLPHGIKGIIVHPRAKVGSNVTIYQHVTIAQNRGLVATIGDNVIIGAGAVIMGGVKIGNNVTIGANSVVTKDLPDNCMAAGVPAKIIKDY